MKKIFIFVILSFFVLSASYHGPVPADDVRFEKLYPEPQHKRITQLTSYLLQKNHYKKLTYDDSLSSEIFIRYLEKLDPAKMYFLASDIKEFEQYRYELDDYIGDGYVQPAFEIFNLYEKRLATRLEYIYKRLETEFDYTIDEYLDIDRDDDFWAESPEELDELWRKRLKHDALNLKLAGKDWEGIKKTLIKRYKRIQKNASQFQSEDVFSLFMNSFTESYDPHTNYFSPKSFDDFKIHMSKALEGIGARLQTDNDYTKVVEIVPGGPADKGKKLFANDRIVSVAQGKDGEFVDVIGWRIDDVVQLIRGKKGTTVRLELLRADEEAGAATDTISIVREKIKLEDQSAQADTLNIKQDGQKFTFGVIDIPSFYSDFEAMRRGDPDYKSTTRDVKNHIYDLLNIGIDGIVIDLRRNGGGFLNEAVDLTGLFIEKGPVVQVRKSNGKMNQYWDTDPELVYDGPLIVLLDRFSASASEIFAAAIQDYNRGIIIGSQSFGKGTVQNPIDLNQFMRSRDNKLGQIKITTAKFYRINGGSTQHVGVMPDISFPSRYELMDIGESSRKNALLWDRIDPLKYNEENDFNETLIGRLSQRQNVRLNSDPEYSELLDNLDEFKKNRDKKLISLNEEKRKAERKKENKQHEEEKNEEDLSEDMKKIMKKREDLLLMESARILGDYIQIRNS